MNIQPKKGGVNLINAEWAQAQLEGIAKGYKPHAIKWLVSRYTAAIKHGEIGTYELVVSPKEMQQPIVIMMSGLLDSVLARLTLGSTKLRPHAIEIRVAKMRQQLIRQFGPSVTNVTDEDDKEDEDDEDERPPRALTAAEKRTLEQELDKYRQLLLKANSLPSSFDEWREKNFVVTDGKDQAEWVRNALAEGKVLHHWRPNADMASDKLRHILDYCNTLPEKEIKQDIPSMLIAVQAWDKLLEKQKLVSSLSDGVKTLKSHVLDQVGLTVVRLQSPDSFKNEGAFMGHCVADYAQRGTCTILSLRKDGEPICTLEINAKKEVIQAKAKHNQEPPDNIRIALGYFFQERSLTDKCRVVKSGPLLGELDDDDDLATPDQQKSPKNKRGEKIKAEDYEVANEDEDGFLVSRRRRRHGDDENFIN